MYNLFKVNPFESVDLLFNRKYGINTERYRVQRAKRFLKNHKEPLGKSILSKLDLGASYERNAYRTTFIKPFLTYLYP